MDNTETWIQLSRLPKPPASQFSPTSSNGVDDAGARRRDDTFLPTLPFNESWSNTLSRPHLILGTETIAPTIKPSACGRLFWPVADGGSICSTEWSSFFRLRNKSRKPMLLVMIVPLLWHEAWFSSFYRLGCCGRNEPAPFPARAISFLSLFGSKTVLVSVSHGQFPVRREMSRSNEDVWDVAISNAHASHQLKNSMYLPCFRLWTVVTRSYNISTLIALRSFSVSGIPLSQTSGSHLPQTWVDIN